MITLEELGNIIIRLTIHDENFMADLLESASLAGDRLLPDDLDKLKIWAGMARVLRRTLSSEGKSVDPSTVFPQRSPATLLRGARNRKDLTQQQLADLCGIARHHISEMENGKRTIGKQNARKLGEVLGVDPRVFL